MTNKILMIQPRHIYAPESNIELFGHIYLPTSLLAAAVIIQQFGYEISVVDENIENLKIVNNVIGVNLLGAPYIPVVIKYVSRLRKIFGEDFLLLIGGQIVSGLSSDEIEKLFGQNVVNGNCTELLSDIFKVDKKFLLQIENLSLIPAYKLLSDSYLKAYLTHELSFYLSKGCKYSCSFCAAQRSFNDDAYKKKQSEIYRDIDIAGIDFEYLINKAIFFGLNNLRIYLSNLDLFQSPDKLQIFANKIIEIKKKYLNINISMRGLSTVRSFIDTHKKFPQIIQAIRIAGLVQVGFGIDGATPQVWKATMKPQNSESECIRAILLAKKEYDLIPEVLMVFGHNVAEDEYSLNLAYKFACDMLEKFGAIPRPHIAKDIVPGNNGWRNPKNHKIVEKFIKNPILFQNLDFTAIPSEITHPDINFRELVAKYYRKVCNLPGCLTKDILPLNPDMTNKEVDYVNNYNLRRYDI